MRYQVREHFFRLGEDSDITDESGRVFLRVDGKVFSPRGALILRDASGAEVGKVQRKLVALRPTYEIEIGGREAATVRKGFFTPFGERFTIDIPGPHDLELRGNLLDHDFTVRRDGDAIATVSKAWFSPRDVYGVEIADGEDPLLILAGVLALDLALDHEREEDDEG